MNFPAIFSPINQATAVTMSSVSSACTKASQWQKALDVFQDTRQGFSSKNRWSQSLRSKTVENPGEKTIPEKSEVLIFVGGGAGTWNNP